ncbi:MAG TPA: hypothetical protein VNS60_06005 [Solirubrobacterales bacterium]|nr:hypothetical protein [Solirubrobacterales bacterium]
MEPRRLHVPSLHLQADKDSRLAGLGLSEKLLEEGMRYAKAEMERCSGNDVNAAEGNAAYSKLIRFLREKLIPDGWSRGSQPGLESVINPDRTFQIVTSSANWATGYDDQMPATKYPKGKRTAETMQDHGQLALDVVHLTQEAKRELKTLFWIYYLDRKKEEIRHELSIPTHMTISPKSKKGRIDEFGSRIILNAIPLESADELDEEHEDDFTDDLDIPVPRRASS